MALNVRVTRPHASCRTRYPPHVSYGHLLQSRPVPAQLLRLPPQPLCYAPYARRSWAILRRIHLASVRRPARPTAHQQRRTTGDALAGRPPRLPPHHVTFSLLPLLPRPQRRSAYVSPAPVTNVHQLRERCRAGALSSALRGTYKVGQSQHPSPPPPSPEVRRHPSRTRSKTGNEKRKTSKEIISGGLGQFSSESPRPPAPSARPSARRHRRTAGEGTVGCTPVSHSAAPTTRCPGVHLPYVHHARIAGCAPRHTLPRACAPRRAAAGTHGGYGLRRTGW